MRDNFSVSHAYFIRSSTAQWQQGVHQTM